MPLISIQLIQEAYTLSFGVLVSAIGIWTAFIDSKHIEKKGLAKEARIYYWLGLIYIFLGAPLALLLQLL